MHHSVVNMNVAHCPYPIVGPNVSVEGYSSGVEGSQITYYCQPGLLPSERMVANCTRNGRWSPSTSLLECSGMPHVEDTKSLTWFHPVKVFAVNCGIPSFSAHSRPLLTSYTTTEEGSTIKFHCTDGFTPNHTITSVCTSEGKWTPDPAKHDCINVSAKCGKILWTTHIM